MNMKTLAIKIQKIIDYELDCENIYVSVYAN